MANEGISKLSYEQISSMEQQLRTDGANMESNLNRIKVQFEKIGTEGVWSGTSASATYDRFKELASKFDSFHQAVTDCAKYLQNVVENYKAVDAAVTRNQ